MRSFYFITCCLISTLFSSIGFGNFTYFDKGVDYWSSRKSESVKEKRKPLDSAKKKRFSWGEVMDPDNDEFFREGDYLPPKGFIELIRDPSDYNIRKWNEYIKKKNELSNRLMKRMKEYLAKNAKVPEATKVGLLSRVKAISTVTTNTQRFKLRFYFSSTCPHCKKMFETAKRLVKRGFFIEGRQVDMGKTPPLPFPISQVSQDEVKGKKISTVPVLLIADTKSQRIYRLNGYQDEASIYQAMNLAP